MEFARTALGQTAARAPARTHRARNLTVLLETADILFARAIRLHELADVIGDQPNASLSDTAQWLGRAERAIAHSLFKRPGDSAASFAPDGTHTLDFLRRRPVPIAMGNTLEAHLAAEERDTRQELEIAFEAIRAIWSGTDSRSADWRKRKSRPAVEPIPPSEVVPGNPFAALLENLRADWSLRSTMLRHALRMAVVGAIDILLLHALHISHGFWLAMTSIIVLQPNGSGTMRRGLQRVGGTLSGGIFAALLAAVIHTEFGIIVVISLGAGLTLASFAIDYGVYCFFLTPTFVLLSLPHLRDWRYAGIRIVTTAVGALVAILAMRLLWPQSEDRELTTLLEAGALADAAYIRAMIQSWKTSDATTSRLDIERRILAPARRACGLASNAAEETLDRLLLEPSFTRNASPGTEHALAFTTYLRRLTQTVTALAALDRPQPARRSSPVTRMETLASRLEDLPFWYPKPRPPATLTLVAPIPEQDVTELQMQRIERQVAILERAALALSAGNTSS